VLCSIIVADTVRLSLAFCNVAVEKRIIIAVPSIEIISDFLYECAGKMSKLVGSQELCIIFHFHPKLEIQTPAATIFGKVCQLDWL
jgi:hypothetical protein